jgi:hypothetical protein
MFTTPPVRAVFPDLNKPDKYGQYKIAIDLLDKPELKADFEAQAAATTRDGQIKFASKKKPTNEIFKQGEHKDVPFERISFKMKEETKRKGRVVKQKPRLVDAQRNPMSEIIWGGSLVRISYFFQYTLLPTGTFITPKLNGVQVLEHVGPNGEVSIDKMFDVEDGYVSSGALPVEEAETEGAEEASDDARDF